MADKDQINDNDDIRYDNAEWHYRAWGRDMLRIITHSNQRNRAGAQANAYWKRQLRKEDRIAGRNELMAAIADWHTQLAEEAEKAEDTRETCRYYTDDFSDHIDDLWEEHLAQPVEVPSQPTRQEMEDQAWAIYERCPLLRRKQKHGLRR